MKANNYTSAPLPFMGQKHKFIKEFKRVLEYYPDDVTIVDLFGGSGLLSHTAKRAKPNATVIYNDFDNYQQRISNISRTNALLERIREVTDEQAAHKMIPAAAKARIMELIAEEERIGFVDYITLSSSLLFSMKYANNMDELFKETFYNRVRKSNYDAAGYLDGLTIVRKDYKELFKDYSNKPNVLFLIDPPYLSTEAGTYTMRWKLGDYLDVLSVLQGQEFIYFTSNKSQIIELCEWIERSKLGRNPFENTQRVEIRTNMNYNSGYIDMMFYKQLSPGECETSLKSAG